MAIEKFKPEVWAAKFMEDLDKKLVFKENCNHSYEGDARKPGDGVRILGLGEIDLGEWHDGKLHTLGTPQEPSGSSIYMPINEIRYFNFTIDDLDQAQAQGGSGLLAKYIEKAKNAMAERMDSFIGKMHVGNCDTAFATPVQVSADGTTGTKAILDVIDEAYLKLLENNVSRDSKITLTAPPWFIMMLKRAYVELDTDNSAMLNNGRVGRYSGIELKESNNVFHTMETVTSGQKDVFHIQLKTDEALAFVNPYTHIEGCRPSDGFADIAKGYTLFDGMPVAPKQCIDINVFK